MHRLVLGASTLVLAASLSLSAGYAQSPAATAPAAAKTKATAAKLPPGMKMCRYKFKSGEVRTWTCDKALPCCAWEEISYVKCGSTITGCL
jgi:nitrous oxide reductase